MLLIRLPSGLKYEVLQAPRMNALGARSGKIAYIHYIKWGKNDSGELFSHGESVQKIVLGKDTLFEGVDEGILSMRVGEKRRFYMPASLYAQEYEAYALIVDIELQELA